MCMWQSKQMENATDCWVFWLNRMQKVSFGFALIAWCYSLGPVSAPDSCTHCMFQKRTRMWAAAILYFQTGCRLEPANSVAALANSWQTGCSRSWNMQQQPDSEALSVGQCNNAKYSVLAHDWWPRWWMASSLKPWRTNSKNAESCHPI